ncbi:MAG TPA: hypothetical protein DCQ06_14835 [Myxococcales bacterium]|nr:hypothetical protein [Myxococcales bacterium]HAN32868.1 hypothetical protein [Myxococcales bacterium]
MTRATRFNNQGIWRSSVALCALLLCVWSADVQAAPPADPAIKTKANFSIHVITAVKGDAPKIDPRLAKMARDLKPFQGQYNQFSLVVTRVLSLAVNEHGQVDLPGSKHFKIKMLNFVQSRARRIRYQVQMPHTKMTRSVAPGGRTLDATHNGSALTIVSTTVR